MIADSLGDPLLTMTDADLIHLHDVLWRDAVRCYAEARAPLDESVEPGDRLAIRKILMQSADSANAAWSRVNDERRRRGI